MASTPTAMTLSSTEYGLIVVPVTAGVACCVATGNKKLH